MYANLGERNPAVKQGSGYGLNGVLRWNYGMPEVGTCRESLEGGNHFRWFVQESPKGNAIFLAPSLEQSLANLHNIQVDGYNRGRDQIVQIATNPNGITWEGNTFNATVTWIEPGRLMNATSANISHAEMAAPGQPVVDGRVAVLYVQTITRSNQNTTQNQARSQLMYSPTWVWLMITIVFLFMYEIVECI
ncbi:hypothetical protein ACI68E_000456 [Malassezia pachydermatis]